MSVFDSSKLLNTTFEDAFSTASIPVPEGEFIGFVHKIEVRPVNDKSVIELTWKLDSQEVAEVTGREDNTVRQTCWLDLTPTGALDGSVGKNVQLGRVREALGQNAAGKPWRIGDMQGGVALVRVKHKADAEGNVNANVVRVTAAE